MNDIAISVKDLSKKFRLGARQERYKTLRDALVETFSTPFRMFNRPKSGARNPDLEPFWALKNISFEIKRGEVVGIIGRNGAGKSTLLKILSRIMEPTTGYAEIFGRVGSLLEVGTGFHGELSGRDNIYLNGAILGMKRSEIDRKFDEIVSFAEVDKFIDTPVKHYSSGMYLRLAFAVAAHLETEILLVDEVLAVGDVQFQKKCLGKMEEVGKEGRTILFVSHNMGAISRLCSKCIWLHEGTLNQEGVVSQTVSAYLQYGAVSGAERVWAKEKSPGDDICRLFSARLLQDDTHTTSTIEINRPFSFQIEIDLMKKLPELGIGMQIITHDGQIALHTAHILTDDVKGVLEKGRWVINCAFPAYLLNSGTYSLSLGADTPNKQMHFMEDNVLTWNIETTSIEMSRYATNAWKGIIGPGMANWVTAKKPLISNDSGI